MINKLSKLAKEQEELFNLMTQSFRRDFIYSLGDNFDVSNLKVPNNSYNAHFNFDYKNKRAGTIFIGSTAVYYKNDIDNFLTNHIEEIFKKRGYGVHPLSSKKYSESIEEKLEE